MSDNTLADATAGNVAVGALWNQYKEALGEDFLPRNLSGAPTSRSGGVGSALYEWDKSYMRDVVRNVTAVDTGTADLSDNEMFLKEATSLVATETSANYQLQDTISFSLDAGSFVNIFFSCESATPTSYTDIAHLLMAPDSSPYVGGLVTDIWDNSSAQVTFSRTSASIYTQSLINMTTSGSYPGLDFSTSPIRIGVTLYFPAGTHSVVILTGLSGRIGSASRYVTYGTCVYGARREV